MILSGLCEKLFKSDVKTFLAVISLCMLPVEKIYDWQVITDTKIVDLHGHLSFIS